MMDLEHLQQLLDLCQDAGLGPIQDPGALLDALSASGLDFDSLTEMDLNTLFDDVPEGVAVHDAAHGVSEGAAIHDAIADVPKGYYNADGTYHYSSDNTDRDPVTGAIVRRW